VEKSSFSPPSFHFRKSRSLDIDVFRAISQNTASIECSNARWIKLLMIAAVDRVDPSIVDRPISRTPVPRGAKDRKPVAQAMAFACRTSQNDVCLASGLA